MNSNVQGENNQPPLSPLFEKIEVMKIRIMKINQMMKREITRLSLNILMIGQLKNRTPRRNRKNHRSLVILPI